MKLLITGATGFVGKNLVARLLQDNHTLCAIVKPSTETITFKKEVGVFVFKDNEEELISFTKNENFDGVIHLASLVLTSHEPKDIKNLVESNIFFPTAVLDAAIKNNIPWFINTGTFWQHYENKKYSPVNLYAATKQAYEAIAQYYIETSAINFVTIKLSDNFGPLDSRSKIFNLLLKIKKTKETLDMSPGQQIIDISYIDNLVDGYVQMINLLSKDTGRKLSGKYFVINANKILTLKKFVSIFEKISKTKLNINWGGKSYRPREVMIPWRKGLRIPGWEPSVSLEEGIKKTLEDV
ncbi:NAD(P)-dependent oxidoreductase [Candidatus Gracilibacteria bacterium]|nr:NAD(P)-dependent oxidoreductase [Candidatus Gracilibacteria bacterium]MCF7898668.1 NAD(P)-dependent oxidoreductase [Candidatus Paceibacterota bacterium]